MEGESDLKRWEFVPGRLADAFRRFRDSERRPLFALLALLAVVIGVWGFIEIADEVQEDEVRTLDVRLLQALRDPANPAELRGPEWLEDAARDVTALGSIVVLTLFTAITVIYLWLQRIRRGALLALGAVCGGMLLYSTLKQGFARVRPIEVPALIEISTHSFPSGHSTISAVVYLSLAVVLALREPRLLMRGYIVAMGIAIAFLIGWSRVALGVHYPTDVLAGWSLGLAWAAACWLILLWLHRRTS